MLSSIRSHFGASHSLQELVLELVSLPAFAFAAEGQEADLTEPEDRAATLLSWSVGELARFLAKKDMEGPAQQLRTQGVAGEDFSAMTEQVLQKELHFSTFTSRKLIKIRDTYLAQDR